MNQMAHSINKFLYPKLMELMEYLGYHEIVIVPTRLKSFKFALGESCIYRNEDTESFRHDWVEYQSNIEDLTSMLLNERHNGLHNLTPFFIALNKKVKELQNLANKVEKAKKITLCYQREILLERHEKVS